MIYKIDLDGWETSLEVGDAIHADCDTYVKVVSIIKVDMWGGKPTASVIGVAMADYE